MPHAIHGRRNEVSDENRIQNYSGRIDPLPDRPENSSRNRGNAEVQGLLPEDACKR